MPVPNNASCSHDVSVPINCSSRGSLAGSEANGDVSASSSEKININVLSVPQNHPPSNPSDMVKIECAEDMSLCAPRNGMNDFSGGVVPAVKAKENKLTDFEFDELDHVVLKDRQKLLLKRKLLEAAKPVLEGNSVSLSEDLTGTSTRRIKEEPQSDNGESELSAARDQIVAISERNGSELYGSSANDALSMEQSADRMKDELQSVDDKLGTGVEECGRICQPERNSVNGLTVQASVKVKVEPSDNNDLQNPSMKTVDNLALGAVKSEVDISDVDHVPLQDRLKLPTSVDNSEMNILVSYECLGKTEFAALDHSAGFSEYAKPKRVGRPRKRRKTATDSIETALEEDAPGLLKVLVDQGVSVDEIKLYGEESTDALDESFSEESFSELEAVITKLFTQRSSSLKFAPIRYPKESRPSYCVACLFSLVEQTRYLQFRKWPVEWGWCRDLQSFIFVFERHHRIVVERPEYGFATYFFELVDSLPIEWQVKRLVTAMKLTSCGRITLIENKPLSVGDDLSEGEAKVLMEYGWVPGTGLGTMLNYQDRVVHDRKNESDSSEWRSKIGKLLMDGYCGGTVVSTTTINELEEDAGNAQQVKMEPLI
ncbi:hypothetical protein SLEP1_g54001 [Rubroshorea leprosula]|uniref:G-patch domain-containing protein n=1 Tax=Rubroshorea leprosula TaxID=152421 RepID=A0AAV5MB08_9ROSI|nr:hypothetical protein SLEP1_g54001 [Rubroshorea leprosula]